MERDMSQNSYEQDPMTSSSASDLIDASYSSSFYSASSFRHDQSNDATFKPNNEPSNEVKERFCQNLKQIVGDEKDKRLEVYQALVSNLQKECSEKDKQLADKAHFIELLQAKSVENEEKLQLNLTEINQLQAKCVEKDAQLVDKTRLVDLLKAKCGENEKQLVEKDARLNDKLNLIKKLQAESAKNKEKLQSKSIEIGKLQEACNRKDSHLNEMMQLVEKLQADCAGKDIQMEATLGRLKSLGKSMHDSSELVNALNDCGLECGEQKRYVEELVYWQNAIELEKATQNRSSILSKLFANKAACYGYLKQYQQCIDAANLALQYDPNYKNAFNNRGIGYEYLKQYSNARQDYEKALQLDPSFEKSRNSLKRVQKHINASASQ